MIKLLQDDKLLSEKQMRKKGQMTFENDSLVEGGILNGMQKGTAYQEVRQYRSVHHLVRYYFITSVYSAYLESILSDFQSGPQPDVLIANSCIWDVMRFDNEHNELEAYKTNLDYLFLRLKEVLSPHCLIIWNMTMPVGHKNDKLKKKAHNLRLDIVEGNFFSSTLADFHKLDVLDMHYHFRCFLRLRCQDATHWNQLAHRKYTQILLTHIAVAWGVEPPKGKMLEGSILRAVPTHLVTLGKNPMSHRRIKERAPYSRGAAYMPRYTRFNESDTYSKSGPAFTHLPCAKRNFPLPNKEPPINFSSFLSRAPDPQEHRNMKIATRREQKPKAGRIHPYSCPPVYRARFC
ncbi:PC-esterase domain-containing protein 1A-like isoform 2-T2 [Anomaloglossus baeobatrachus]|uniref:PC-esterase domain-containing protein 1A-like n=1 Tax=Anomaloglossus baeobatrachus TaxID=238106 RepID=UPI003F506D14